ncbi:hypothetical protein G3N57_23300 [Paraburkholderia sp. Se-20369]|nr:hypothetical protein [Paraburkholderia sp. Se-20369]
MRIFPARLNDYGCDFSLRKSKKHVAQPLYRHRVETKGFSIALPIVHDSGYIRQPEKRIGLHKIMIARIAVQRKQQRRMPESALTFLLHVAGMIKKSLFLSRSCVRDGRRVSVFCALPRQSVLQ